MKANNAQSSGKDQQSLHQRQMLLALQKQSSSEQTSSAQPLSHLRSQQQVFQPSPQGSKKHKKQHSSRKMLMFYPRHMGESSAFDLEDPSQIQGDRNFGRYGSNLSVSSPKLQHQDNVMLGFQDRQPGSSSVQYSSQLALRPQANSLKEGQLRQENPLLNSSAVQQRRQRQKEEQQLSRQLIEKQLTTNSQQMSPTQKAVIGAKLIADQYQAKSSKQADQKKPQKLLKVKRVIEDEHQALSSNRSTHMLTSKGVVVRQGTQLTQVNLKLKTTATRHKNSGKDTQGQAQFIPPTQSLTQPPSATNKSSGNRRNIFLKQQQTATSGTREQKQPRVQSLRQKMMENDIIGSRQAHRVAATSDIEDNPLARINQFTDNLIEPRDQIPGNSQEMVKSPRENARRQASSAMDSHKAREGQLLKQRNQNMRQPVTPMPGQLHKSVAMRDQKEERVQIEYKKNPLSRIIVDKDTFPMLSLLPPQIEENERSDFFGALRHSNVSKDQERMQQENWLRRRAALGDNNADCDNSVNERLSNQLSSESGDNDGAITQSIKMFELRGEETKDSIAVDPQILGVAHPHNIQLQIQDQRNAQRDDFLEQRNDNQFEKDPLNEQVQTVQLKSYVQKADVNKSVGMHSQLEGQCSPREISTSANFSSSAIFSQQNKPLQSSSGAQQKHQRAIYKPPFVFNELRRENFELVIGDEERRKVVMANHQARKSELSQVVKPSLKGQHVRNHSELLSAQFKKDSKQEKTSREQSPNDKFNVDGNIGVSSSDDDYRSQNQQKGEQEQSKNEQSVMHDMRPEETSIGDLELDEDPGSNYQPLQQQISKHTIGERTMPDNSAKLRYHRKMTNNYTSSNLLTPEMSFVLSQEGRQRGSNEQSVILKNSVSSKVLLSHKRFQIDASSNIEEEKDFRAITDASEAIPDDEYDFSGQNLFHKTQKTNNKLNHSTSVASQMVPATMVKRKKQSEEGSSRFNFIRSPMSAQGGGSSVLRQFFRQISPDHTEATSDNAGKLLQSVQVKNVDNRVRFDQKDFKQIKLLNTSYRGSHFEDSRMAFKLDLLAAQSTITEGQAANTRVENIPSSERLLEEQSRRVNQTALMNMTQQPIEKQSVSNTDNKGDKTPQQIEQSNRSDKHTLFRTIAMSPVAAPTKLNTVRESIASQGPQPMDSISDFRKLSHLRNQTIDQDGMWPAVSREGQELDVMSNQYLMSSIGQVNDDPAGVCMYEMREFMNEPGASKQLTAGGQSKRYQLLMQQQRMMRAQFKGERVDFEDDSELYDDLSSTVKHTREATGQKHATKRQKSIETSSSRYMGRAEGTDSIETLPQEFKIIKNGQNQQEVKLKILRRETMYVPREVLQDATIFSQVTVLDVSNCRIVELEGRIFMQLKNLSKLFAARNQIKYLSGRIAECSKLTHINLDCNKLEMIPSEIGQLSKTLITLKLAQNKLKQLTLSTRELCNLEILNISENRLSELPEGIEMLQNLKELHLASNPLLIFNVHIARMPKLTKLSLDWFSFLIPAMPSTIQRQSDFDIDTELMLSDSKQKSNLREQLDNSTDMRNNRSIFSPKLQKHADDQPQAPKSGLRKLSNNKSEARVASPNQTKETDLGMLSAEQAVLSDDEGYLLIASERNNKKAGEAAKADASASQAKVESSGRVTPVRCTTPIRKVSLHESNPQGVKDAFKELAILIERSYSSTPLIKQDDSSKSTLKGLRFTTFAEHFWRLQHGKEELAKGWVSAQDAKGRTMLHYAAQKGDLKVVEALIERGADKTIIDQYSFNPYGLALREEHYLVAMYLLRTPSFAYFDVFRGAGTFGSLLHLAVTKLQPEQVKILLEHDVNPNLKDQISGDTPLHVLMNIYQRDPEPAREIIKSLADYGASFNERNKDNWTPFHLAVKRGCLEAIKCILEVAGNKTQKSWLAAKTQNPDYVDIDALGGPHNVTALHIASESNFYDIVDVLFQYKSDLFQEDDRGNTPFTGINNNLLMIKLLKKEQKSFFNETFKQKLQAKEMHIINNIFLGQALKSHAEEDQILAQHIKNGAQYHSFKDTLQSVQSQLQLPLRTHKQAVFKRQEIVFNHKKEQTEESIIETERDVLGGYVNQPLSRSDDSDDGEDDCNTIASDDLNENRVENDMSRRSVSPKPGSLTRSSEQQNALMYTRPNEHAQTQNDLHYHKRHHPHSNVDESPTGQTSLSRNQVKHTMPIRTKSPDMLQQNTAKSWQPLQGKSRQKLSQTSTVTVPTTQAVVVNLRNMIQSQQVESPRFFQQDSQQQNQSMFSVATADVAVPKTQPETQQNLFKKGQTLQVLDQEPSWIPATAPLHHMQTSPKSQASTTLGVKKLALDGILKGGLAMAAQSQINNKITPEQKPLVTRASLTLKTLNSGATMGNSLMRATQKEVSQSETVRSGVAEEPDKLITMLSIQSPKVAQEDHQTFRASANADREEQKKLDDNLSFDTIEDNIFGSLKDLPIAQVALNEEVTFRKSQVDQFYHPLSKTRTAAKLDEKRNDSANIESIEVIEVNKQQRQNSVKAPIQRRLDAFGSESGEIRLTVNASKNLFDNELQRLASSAQSAYQDYSRRTVMLSQNRPTTIHQPNSQKVSRVQHDYGPRADSLSNQNSSRVTTQNGSVLAQREQRLKDQKNSAILSQSIKQRTRINFEPHSSKPTQPTQLKSQTTNKLKIDSTDGRRASAAALLKSVVSPSAVLDDDMPYSGIEMPAHQPTMQMERVISESNYSSQGGGRGASQSSRKSTHGQLQPRATLDQLLNRTATKREPSSTQDFMSRQNMNLTSSGSDARVQTHSQMITTKMASPVLLTQGSRDGNLNPTARSHSLSKHLITKATVEQTRQSEYANIDTNLSIPQQARVLNRTNLIIGEGPKPFFYKYLNVDRAEQQHLSAHGESIPTKRLQQQMPVPHSSARKGTKQQQATTPSKSSLMFFQ